MIANLIFESILSGTLLRLVLFFFFKALLLILSRYHLETSDNTMIPIPAKTVNKDAPFCPNGTKIRNVKTGASELPKFPPTC